MKFIKKKRFSGHITPLLLEINYFKREKIYMIKKLRITTNSSVLTLNLRGARSCNKEKFNRLHSWFWVYIVIHVHFCDVKIILLLKLINTSDNNLMWKIKYKKNYRRELKRIHSILFKITRWMRSKYIRLYFRAFVNYYLHEYMFTCSINIE